jgi:hypothetical protein
VFLALTVSHNAAFNRSRALASAAWSNDFPLADSAPHLAAFLAPVSSF